MPFPLRHARRGYVIEKGRIRHAAASTEEFHPDPALLERFLSV